MIHASSSLLPVTLESCPSSHLRPNSLPLWIPSPPAFLGALQCYVLFLSPMPSNSLSIAPFLLFTKHVFSSIEKKKPLTQLLLSPPHTAKLLKSLETSLFFHFYLTSQSLPIASPHARLISALRSSPMTWGHSWSLSMSILLILPPKDL